jgi:hypothetical protein
MSATSIHLHLQHPGHPLVVGPGVYIAWLALIAICVLVVVFAVADLQAAPASPTAAAGPIVSGGANVPHPSPALASLQSPLWSGPDTSTIAYC